MLAEAPPAAVARAAVRGAAGGPVRPAPARRGRAPDAGIRMCPPGSALPTRPRRRWRRVARPSMPEAGTKSPLVRGRCCSFSSWRDVEPSAGMVVDRAGVAPGSFRHAFVPNGRGAAAFGLRNGDGSGWWMCRLGWRSGPAEIACGNVRTRHPSTSRLLNSFNSALQPVACRRSWCHAGRTRRRCARFVAVVAEAGTDTQEQEPGGHCPLAFLFLPTESEKVGQIADSWRVHRDIRIEHR